eukprot:scaffold47232_cov57-Cyclotella_meneghiniana.AAC.1
MKRFNASASTLILVVSLTAYHTHSVLMYNAMKRHAAFSSLSHSYTRAQIRQISHCPWNAPKRNACGAVRYNKKLHYSSTTMGSTTAKGECMLTLQPDNFSRYSKYLVGNSNGVDGLGNTNTITNEEGLVWVDTLGEGCLDNPDQFSLLSWNLLAQALYEPFCKSVGSEPHSWSNRVQRIIEVLSHADSDILCLQECELESFHNDLIPGLSNLYDGVAQEDERSDSEKPTPLKEITKHRSPRNHITATFWKRDKFEPVGESSVRTRSMTNVLRLKTNSERSPLVAVVNCHLEGHPKRFSERTHQLQHALTDLSKLMKKDCEKSQTPLGNHLNGIIIAGDFNCELQSSACSTYLQLGRLGRQAGLGGVHGEDSLVIPPALLETNEATEILHPIVEWGRALPEAQVSDVSPHPFRRNGMMSAYPKWLGKTNAKEHFTYINTMNKRPVPGLDQLWYSSMTMKRVALKRPIVDFLGQWGDDPDIIERKRNQERIDILSTGLPDPKCTYPSDHLPIGAVFDWQWESNHTIRNITVLDDEGNIVDFTHQDDTSQPEFKLYEQSFENPNDELEYLISKCPYDSVDQRLAVEFILSPVNPPLCTEKKTKPTRDQLDQINKRRDVKSEVLASCSSGVKPWLKKIWKANRQVGARERSQELE